jgi:hypothetical protein
MSKLDDTRDHILDKINDRLGVDDILNEDDAASAVCDLAEAYWLLRGGVSARSERRSRVDAAAREVLELGVSQCEAARHFGVDQSSVSRAISGDRRSAVE